MEFTPKAIKIILDELEASRASRKKTGLGESAGNPVGAQGHDRHRAASPEQKTIDLEGRVLKDGVRKVLKDGLETPNPPPGFRPIGVEQRPR